jgi:hypothetical protein
MASPGAGKDCACRANGDDTSHEPAALHHFISGMITVDPATRDVVLAPPMLNVRDPRAPSARPNRTVARMGVDRPCGRFAPRNP